MIASIQPIADFIVQHSAWTWLLAGLAAFGESMALIGIVLPGTAILVGVGAAAELGKLPLWPIIFWATLGAIAGDHLSFWLGHRHRHRIAQIWPFSRRPDLLAKGEALVRQHGGTSVAVARFMPLLRAVVPLAAGAFGMSRSRFTIANVLSAIAWAPAFILPGASAGAVFGVLAQISERLAAIVLGATLLVILAIWLLRRPISRVVPAIAHARQVAMSWGRQQWSEAPAILPSRSQYLRSIDRNAFACPRVSLRHAHGHLPVHRRSP